MHERTLHIAIAVACLGVVILGAAPAEAALTCYCDTDGDGYASDTASAVTTNGTTCPAPPRTCMAYVVRKGDCQRTDPNSHPRTYETYGDYIDNNCDGSIDEPQFIYHTTAPLDSDRAILHLMQVQINDLTTAFRLVYSPASIGYRLEITSLDGSPVDGSTSASTEILPVSGPATSFWFFSSTSRVFSFVSFTAATRLKPHRFYKVRVRIYSDGAPVGPWSNAYYTQSSGNAADPTDDIERRRMDIALLAFEQVGDSQYGLVGHAGTEPHGWRYAHNPDGTVDDVNWESGYCDMFWGWVAYNAVRSDFLIDLPLNSQRKGFVDPHDENPGDSFDDGIHHTDASYWDDGRGTAGSFYFNSNLSNPASGDPGDFLLAQGHAGMYLATHVTSGRIITVEGNVGDEVIVNETGRPNVWPPPAAPAARNFWVGIGRLNSYELGL